MRFPLDFGMVGGLAPTRMVKRVRDQVLPFQRQGRGNGEKKDKEKI